jgi:thiamine-phosphate pyrophosphorylase
VSTPQPFPSLYPILDAHLALGKIHDRWEHLRRIVHELADSGVEILQYRNKQETGTLKTETDLIEEAQALRKAAPPGMKLILNDHVSLVSLTGFDGVHVGQHDLPPAEARDAMGNQRIVGISTHNEAQLRLADQAPVDYIAVGPVFSTVSKQNPELIIGLEGVRLARKLTAKPLVAIGGITLENAASVYEAGADSIAVISAIFNAIEPPGKIAKDFLRIFK